MKTLALLIVLLIAGFAFWKFGAQNSPYIPTAFDTKSPSQPAAIKASQYTVVKGDTLHSLAKRYGTTVSNIQKLNNLSNSNIKVGDKLTISSKQRPKATSVPSPKRVTVASKPVTPTPQPSAINATPTPKAKSKKPLTRQQLPKSTVMESSRIAIDIDDLNQVYLKKSNGKFSPAGSIIYGSDADKNGNEVKTITYRDLSGKETTLSGSADAEEVIRIALKKKK